MVLRHSYKVELQRLRVTMKALELDLAMRPDNVRAQQQLEELRHEEQWYTNKIARGEDPGVVIL